MYYRILNPNINETNTAPHLSRIVLRKKQNPSIDLIIDARVGYNKTLFLLLDFLQDLFLTLIIAKVNKMWPL